MTFKDVKTSTWEEAKQSLVIVLGELIRKVLREHFEGIYEEDAKFLKKLLEEENLAKYAYSLQILTRVLSEKYGKKVILLIDEYDVPIEAAHTYQHRDPDYYENMVAFMRNLLTAALKDNPYLEFAVLTGVYRAAKESIFSGLNNVAVYTIFENEMSDKFGFTEDEVHKILKHYDLEDELDAIREWYDGYVFGNVEGMYNPWSVIYYVKERLAGKSMEKALQPYWINTSSNDLIVKQIEMNPFLQQDLDKLVLGDELVVEVDPFLSLREMDQNPSGVWTLLAHAGYLNAYQMSADEYRISLPNKEIEKFYKKVISSWLEGTLNVSFYNMIRELKEAMKFGRVEGFVKLLEVYLRNSLSYFDVGYDDAERVYKAFVLGMLSMATNGYVVETEVESGYGRVDIAVYPKDRRFGKYSLVMELKKAESEEKLTDAVEEALKQIQDKGYTVKYERMGYTVISIGMAFYKRRVVVKGAYR